MEKLTLKCDQSGIRLDLWLLSNIDLGKKIYSRSFIQKLIIDKMVTVNSSYVKPGYKLNNEDEVIVTIPEPQSIEVIAEDIRIPIIYEDDNIVVVDKPKGIVVHPAPGNYSGTLVNAMLGHCKDRLSDISGVLRPGIVHRIDKETSGVLVIAKSNIAHKKLSELFKYHDINRTYVAIVYGVITENFGKIVAPIGRHPVDRKKMSVNTKNGRPATTNFEVLERFKSHTYIRLELETGRTHQIRVHMAYINHPIIGDEVYGPKNSTNVNSLLDGVKGQALHAKTLEFMHPTKNLYMQFESELPEYFKILLEKLETTTQNEN